MSSGRHHAKWIDQGVSIGCPHAPVTAGSVLFFDWHEETDGETVKACPECGTGVSVVLELEVREGGGSPDRDQAPQ